MNVGYWDLFWPQFIQGISLSLLFVPLTTITMNRIAKENMGNATSLFNLLRNIGGSVGIAGVITMFARWQQSFTNVLGEHVTAYSQQSQTLLSGLRSMFQAKGSDPVTASHQAYAAVFGMVQRHSVMLSFLEVFRVLALIFALMIPLILIMKRPGKGGPSDIAAH
jgi:DHA2 family multidrug resistance protein